MAGTRARKNSGNRPTDSDAGKTFNGSKIGTAVHVRIGAVCAALAAAVAVTSLLWQVWRPQSSGHMQTTEPRDRAEPKVYGFRVIQRYQHDPLAFTQGLLWLNGSLYESTGLFGRSSVRELRLEGKEARVVRQVDAEDPKDFGEGLTYWRGEMLQLLWRRGDGRRYSASPGDGGHLEHLGPSHSFRTPLSDGWGLATDGQVLLATDSGPKVFTLDPETFQEVRQAVTVTDAGQAIEMLNELEVIDGELWANVFGKECLARIALDGSGAVLGWVDLTGLLDRRKANKAARRAHRDPPDVLNGIAWDSENRRLFVTGKLWPYLYQIELVEEDVAIDIKEARRRCIPEENVFRRA